MRMARSNSSQRSPLRGFAGLGCPNASAVASPSRSTRLGAEGGQLRQCLGAIVFSINGSCHSHGRRRTLWIVGARADRPSVCRSRRWSETAGSHSRRPAGRIGAPEPDRPVEVTVDQEYVVAVTSGTREDREGLDRLIDREHPQAKRLSSLTRLQTTARNRSAHELWLDEAEVLLYRECERAGVGRPASEDRLTLYRIPLRSAACNRLLEFVSVAPNRWLEERRDTPFASSSAVMAMKALQELFTVELARLRLDHDSPAGIDQAIQEQIAWARPPQEDTRRRVFRDWHLRQICDTPLEPTPADAARALGYAPHRPPQDLVQVFGAFAAYRDEVAYLPTTQGPSTSSRGYLHQYYEFRTVGRQLTDRQRMQLHKTIKNATIKPDLMVVDLIVDTRSYDLPWCPEEIFAKYFDAALHFDQSGKRILWLRLPGALAEQAMPYNTRLSPNIRFESGDLLVEIYYSEDDAEGCYLRTDPRPWLRELMPVRDGLIAGDLRALYLAWREVDEYWKRKSGYPPIPPEIDTLTPELKALDKFLTWSPGIHGEIDMLEVTAPTMP